MNPNLNRTGHSTRNKTNQVESTNSKLASLPTPALSTATLPASSKWTRSTHSGAGSRHPCCAQSPNPAARNRRTRRAPRAWPCVEWRLAAQGCRLGSLERPPVAAVGWLCTGVLMISSEHLRSVLYSVVDACCESFVCVMMSWVLRKGECRGKRF